MVVQVVNTNCCLEKERSREEEKEEESIFPHHLSKGCWATSFLKRCSFCALLSGGVLRELFSSIPRARSGVYTQAHSYHLEAQNTFAKDPPHK